MGLPVISASGLPGKRCDAYRAGMMPTCNGERRYCWFHVAEFTLSTACCVRSTRMMHQENIIKLKHCIQQVTSEKEHLHGLISVTKAQGLTTRVLPSCSGAALIVPTDQGNSVRIFCGTCLVEANAVSPDDICNQCVIDPEELLVNLTCPAEAGRLCRCFSDCCAARTAASQQEAI